MATVINNPDSTSDGSGGMGFLLGVIVLVIFVILLFVYGIPYLSNSVSQPQVNVPDKVDVNVNQPAQ